MIATLAHLVATTAGAFWTTYTRTLVSLARIITTPPRFALHLVAEHPRPAGAVALVMLAALAVAAYVKRRPRVLGDFDRHGKCRACRAFMSEPHGVGCPLDYDPAEAFTPDTAHHVAEALAEIAAHRSR